MKLTSVQRENIEKVYGASKINDVAANQQSQDAHDVFSSLLASLALTPGDAPYVEVTFGASQYGGEIPTVRFDGITESSLVTYSAPMSRDANTQPAEIEVRRLTNVETWRVDTRHAIYDLSHDQDSQVNDMRIAVQFLDGSNYILSDSPARQNERVGHLIAALASRLASR